MGYTNLATDSIYPSIIIHFINNFLSVYFSFGNALNWPFARFIYTIESFFTSNLLLFICSASIGILTILILYQQLIKTLMKERTKRDLKTLVKTLKSNNVPLIEAQVKINNANKILKDKNTLLYSNKTTTKPNFTDNIFLTSSILLGSMVTICSFIWGIL